MYVIFSLTLKAWRTLLLADKSPFPLQAGKAPTVTSSRTTALTTLVPMAPPAGMGIVGTRALVPWDSLVDAADAIIKLFEFYMQ